jgi:hypothetical protein
VGANRSRDDSPCALQHVAHVNAGVKLEVTANIAAFGGELFDRGDAYAGTGGLRIRW